MFNSKFIKPKRTISELPDPENLEKEAALNTKSKNVDKKKAKVKKTSSKAPVELPNNALHNPYRRVKLTKKCTEPKKLVPRDPRFSEFSGKLNMDMFKKSYEFLNDMRDEEVREIRAAIKISKKHGTESAKGLESMKKLAHLNISDLDEAKRALDRYKSEKVQLAREEELRGLKRSLVKEEKEKIATTGKKPYYFSHKKVKKLYKEMQTKKAEESMKSTSLDRGSGKTKHNPKSQSRKNPPKQRRLKTSPETECV